MAWNESGNGKNPWDRGGRGQDGPPDLDKIVREWQQRFTSLFGGRRRRSGNNNSSPIMLLGLVAIAVVWVLFGFYRVDAAERGVVLRFGRFEEITFPGLRWHLPYPIETVEKINVEEVVEVNQQTSMLTADENIVLVDVVVQYRRSDPEAYAFNVRDPTATLQDAAESAIREVIGRNDMDFILGPGRSEIALDTGTVIQEALDDYANGIQVFRVNLKDVNFPGAVEPAVQDVVKAREDEERFGLEAQTYRNDILPRARGESARRVEDAEGYKARVIADAEGEADRFEKLLSEYEKAPRVTRDRLYIEAIEDVYSGSNKVLLDASGSGNLLYLPIDKIMEQQQSGSMRNQGGGGSASGSSGSQDPAGGGSRDGSADSRARGSR